MNNTQLKIIKNFFNNDEISFIKECAEEYLKTKKNLGSKLGYDKKNKSKDSFNTPSNKMKVYDISEETDFKLYNIINDKVKKEFGMEILFAKFYYFKNTQNIDWHYDYNDDCSGAASIYLNINWEKNWGGYFVYEKNEKLGIEMPEYNKCIFQSGPILHAITSVSSNASYRKSLQIFFKK